MPVSYCLERMVVFPPVNEVDMNYHFRLYQKYQKYFLKGTMTTMTSSHWVYNTEFLWSLTQVPWKGIGVSRVIGKHLLFMVGLWGYTWVYNKEEVSLGGPPESFRMGAGHAGKTNHVIRELGLRVTWYQPYLLISWRGKGCWRLGLLTWPMGQSAYVMKSV